MRICLGCGCELVRNSQKLYCSVRCMWDAERRRRVQVWLDTGVGRADSHANHYIREHIAQEQGGHCAICHLPPIWNKQPLTLVLDHVDGDASNNRRNNLRLVCPNCDSQLPTFKMRSKGKGRYSRRQRYAEGKSF